MGTEVLRPQDCLIERMRVGPATVVPRRRSYTASSSTNFSSSNPKCYRKTIIRPESKKSSSSSNSFGIGQVTILKRGESLDVKKRKDENLRMVSSTGDLIICGSDPKSIGSEIYAGSAFYLSPSPSDLPLPSFSIKKEELVIVDDSATKDLRRLLRLD